MQGVHGNARVLSRFDIGGLLMLTAGLALLYGVVMLAWWDRLALREQCADDTLRAWGMVPDDVRGTQYEADAWTICKQNEGAIP